MRVSREWWFGLGFLLFTAGSVAWADDPVPLEKCVAVDFARIDLLPKSSTLPIGGFSIVTHRKGEKGRDTECEIVDDDGVGVTALPIFLLMKSQIIIPIQKYLADYAAKNGGKNPPESEAKPLVAGFYGKTLDAATWASYRSGMLISLKRMLDFEKRKMGPEAPDVGVSARPLRQPGPSVLTQNIFSLPADAPAPANPDAPAPSPQVALLLKSISLFEATKTPPTVNEALSLSGNIVNAAMDPKNPKPKGYGVYCKDAKGESHGWPDVPLRVAMGFDTGAEKGLTRYSGMDGLDDSCQGAIDGSIADVSIGLANPAPLKAPETAPR